MLLTVWKFVQKQPPKVFYKKGVLKNIAKFTGKHLCWSLLFNKVKPATLLKKILQRNCSPVNFGKFLKKNTSFIKHLRWLLLTLLDFLESATKTHCLLNDKLQYKQK